MFIMPSITGLPDELLITLPLLPFLSSITPIKSTAAIIMYAASQVMFTNKTTSFQVARPCPHYLY